MVHFTKKEKKDLLRRDFTQLDQKFDGEFEDGNYILPKKNRLFSPKIPKNSKKQAFSILIFDQLSDCEF